MSTLTLFFTAWYDGGSVMKNRGYAEMNGSENKRIIVLGFTGAGTALGRELCGKLKKNGYDCQGYAPGKYAGENVLPLPEDRSELIGGQWGRAAFLFIGAAGIAVRWIVPWVKDKYTDSPVLVMDEKGQYVVPILSGHVGGAAALADEIAGLAGGTAVHTTATDVQGKFAVDVFARKHGLEITDRRAAKAVSAAVLDGEKIALYIEEAYGDMLTSEEKTCLPEDVILCGTVLDAEKCRYRVMVTGQRPSEKALWLKPMDMAAGIGCRKDISPELLEKGFLDVLKENGISIRQIRKIASIDLKKDEAAILRLAEKYDFPFVTYPADELRTVEEVTAGSEFVEKVTGVDNVCERAARLCARNRETGADGELIWGKCIREGMTAALAAYPAGTERLPDVGGGSGATSGILIFAGTTEGRLLAEYASAHGIGCFVSVATEYGKCLLGDLEHVTVLAGRMDEKQIEAFIEENRIRLVIDATHPFAQAATANIMKACEEAAVHLPVRYVRCVRQDGGSACGKAYCEKRRHKDAVGTENIVWVDSVPKAVGYLRQTTGNILIATGSKELHLYTAIEDYRERCFARVLSTGPSVAESVRLGFEGSHLIAMQGPFSTEMNLALLRQTEAAYFVTKETGRAGGFDEKLEAASKAGAVLVVVGRPEEDGESLETVKKLLANPIFL